MKRIAITLLSAGVLHFAPTAIALDWIDEHLDDTNLFVTVDVPNADTLPLIDDLHAERTPATGAPSSTAEIEEPRLDTQRVEVVDETTEVKVFKVNFSQTELQHALNLENASLSTQAHAAYNRAIDVAATKGKEQLLQALLARAGFYLRHRDLDGAESDYRAAIELVNADNRYALADYIAGVYAQQGFWEESLPWYSRKIGINPKSISGYTERAYAYVKLNRYRTALLDYEVALSLTDDEDVRQRIEFERAKLYFALGDRERADASFARSPQTAAYLRIKAQFYQSQNRTHEAIEAYERLLAQEPRFAGEYALRGEWHALRGNFALAVADFNRAVELAPEDASVVARRAHFYMAQKEYDLALQDYTKAINLDPDAAHRYADRARLLLSMQAYDLAIADFSRAIDLEPTRAFRYNERAASYQRRGQSQLALNDYAQALRLDPGNVTALSGLSELQNR